MAQKQSKVLSALVGVITSGIRRRPEHIRQQALVSFLYPYYFEDSFTVGMPEVVDIGEPFQPFDHFEVAMPTISFIELKEPIIEWNYPPEDEFKVAMPLIQGIELETYDPFVYVDYPLGDEFAPSMPLVIDIEINTVAIRFDYPEGDEFAPDMPVITAIVLETV